MKLMWSTLIRQQKRKQMNRKDKVAIAVCTTTLRLRISGQITIYASISIVLVLTLVCASIRSATISFAKAGVDAACRLSMEAVFSGYANPILDEFDILLLKKTDVLDSKLKKYVEENTENLGVIEGIRCENAVFDDFTKVTDSGGIYLRQEVLAYMDFGVYTELLENIKAGGEQRERAQAVNQVTEELVKCEEELRRQNEGVLELVPLVEGIEADTTGIVINNGKPVVVDGAFAKLVVHEETSMTSAAVDNKSVYSVLTGQKSRYCDVDKLIEGMLLDGRNSQKYDDYVKLKEVILAVEQKTQQALEKIHELELGESNPNDRIIQCKNSIGALQDKLGESLTTKILNDLDGVSSNIEDSGGLCDIQQIKKALTKNLSLLQGAQPVMSWIESSLINEKVELAEQQILECKEILSGVSNENLKFDYTGVDFSKEAEGIGSIKRLYQSLTTGISGFVMEGKQLSDKVISGVDLASELYDANQIEQSSTTIKENAIYNEYLFTKFNTYTDYIDKDNCARVDTGKVLDYMVEFILCGNYNDRENMNDTIMKLSMIREGINMAFLMTDNAKKNEAFVLATGLVGATGNMAVVKFAQYLIMAAWAYGESIVDMKQLFKGEKVALNKDATNWNLSLDNLLKMNFSENTSSQERGLSYEDHLRMLLLSQNAGEKYFRTMGAIEMRMIELGHADIRMKNYVCSASATVEITIKLLNQTYIRKLQYSYI